MAEAVGMRSPCTKGACMATAPPVALLTVREVADLLRISPSSVWRLHRTEGLPGVRPGRDLRFRLEDVEAWIASRATGASDAG
jgi:excisionase family DNA binding protein